MEEPDKIFANNSAFSSEVIIKTLSVIRGRKEVLRNIFRKRPTRFTAIGTRATFIMLLLSFSLDYVSVRVTDDFEYVYAYMNDICYFLVNNGGLWKEFVDFMKQKKSIAVGYLNWQSSRVKFEEEFSDLAVAHR